jgi:hypothetical protein
MQPIYLADLQNKTEAEVKAHLADEYAGNKSGFDYGNPTDEDKLLLAKRLEGFDVLVAYEHVGSWGCDSSSWFLLKDKKSGALFEVHGSHCSCYGFEGQFDLEPTTAGHLKSDKFYLSVGGYDDDADGNQQRVKEFLKSL